MTQQSTQNLTEIPWIPVIGRNEPQSLRDIFSDLTICRLAGNPVEKIAMLRLLLSVTHAAVPVPDTAAWQALTPQSISNSVLPYLEKWHDRFFLYDTEHPFLQMPQLTGHDSKIASPAALQARVASGNKPVFSHWNLPTDMSDADLAFLLVLSSGFGCGGKKYDNSIILTPGYSGKLNDKGTTASGTPGTLLGCAGYLHSYLLGNTLLDTIRLNMLTDEDIKELGAFPDGLGRPFWEDMPSGEDCDRAKSYRRSYQGELFPLDRFFLIQNGKIIMTDGIAYPNHKNGLIDPALTIFTVKNDGKAIWANPEKRPWRELPSILSFLQAEQSKSAPFTISLGLVKMLPDEQMITLWTGGLQVSSNAGEQFPAGHNDYVESVFTFPRANLASTALGIYKKMMDKLLDYSRVLYKSVAAFYKELNDLSGPDIAKKAESAFWERMEPSAQHIIDVAFTDNPLEDACKEEYRQWQKDVIETYNQFCPQETARQLIAWADHSPDFREHSNKKQSAKEKTKGLCPKTKG